METGVFGMDGKLNAEDAHLSVNYGSLLSDGLRGYEERARKLQEELDLTDPDSIDKNIFCKAVLTVIESDRSFALRYSRLAQELAEKETDVRRRAELQTILDPERFAIGGGINAQPVFIEYIKNHLKEMYAACPYDVPQAEVVSCKFQNDANLIGALHCFLTE
ncbi:MAG: hypothetical protein NC121_19240 [Blautia sp.]|nr:hypothetical protein [Blautia sp.]